MPQPFPFQSTSQIQKALVVIQSKIKGKSSTHERQSNFLSDMETLVKESTLSELEKRQVLYGLIYAMLNDIEANTPKVLGVKITSYGAVHHDLKDCLKDSGISLVEKGLCLKAAAEFMDDLTAGKKSTVIDQKDYQDLWARIITTGCAVRNEAFSEILSYDKERKDVRPIPHNYKSTREFDQTFAQIEQMYLDVACGYAEKVKNPRDTRVAQLAAMNEFLDVLKTNDLHGYDISSSAGGQKSKKPATTCDADNKKKAKIGIGFVLIMSQIVGTDNKLGKVITAQSKKAQPEGAAPSEYTPEEKSEYISLAIKYLTARSVVTTSKPDEAPARQWNEKTIFQGIANFRLVDVLKAGNIAYQNAMLAIVEAHKVTFAKPKEATPSYASQVGAALASVVPNSLFGGGKKGTDVPAVPTIAPDADAPDASGRTSPSNS